nr:Mfa1 family fimbria major subunit [Prevotella sp. UBA4952]
MKVNKILVLGMLVTSIFASCSNEDTAENGSKGLVNGDAYITLSVSGSGIQGSRTTGNNHQNATPDESKINNLALYLVDPGSKAVVFSTDVAAAQLISNTATDHPTYTTTPISVGTGVMLDTPYDVYVVANKNVNDIAMGNTWDAAKVLSTANSDATDFYKSATDGNFTMFNESNPGVNASGKVTITSTNDSKSNPARVNADGTTIQPIKLDRLTAKVQAQDGSTSGSNLDISGITGKQASFISEISMVGYVILNGVQSTYLQQTWSGTTASYVLNTPSSNTFYGQFTNYATVTPGTTAGTGTLMDKTSDGQVSFTTPENSVYCLENNTGINNSDDKVTNTTGLILKYQVTVKESDGLAGSNCFYGYNGQYFEKLSDIQATYPNVFGTSVAATDLQTAKDLLTKNGNGTATEQSISDFRARYNIEVFRNGIMYYTYFIKDQNYTDPTVATGADNHIYAVLRNTVYDLHVASLLRIGNDIPGGWNPGGQNTPVDQKDYYMQVQVSVNPWVLSSTNINLQ